MCLYFFYDCLIGNAFENYQRVCNLFLNYIYNTLCLFVALCAFLVFIKLLIILFFFILSLFYHFIIPRYHFIIPRYHFIIPYCFFFISPFLCRYVSFLNFLVYPFLSVSISVSISFLKYHFINQPIYYFSFLKYHFINQPIYYILSPFLHHHVYFLYFPFNLLFHILYL